MSNSEEVLSHREVRSSPSSTLIIVCIIIFKITLTTAGNSAGVMKADWSPGINKDKTSLANQ